MVGLDTKIDSSSDNADASAMLKTRWAEVDRLGPFARPSRGCAYTVDARFVRGLGHMRG